MKNQDYIRAIDKLKQSVAILPHFKTLELIGECYIQLGKLNEAIPPLAAAISLNDQVRAPAMLSDVFLRLNEYEKAEKFAKLALSRHADNNIAKRVLGEIQKHKGAG